MTYASVLGIAALGPACVAGPAEGTRPRIEAAYDPDSGFLEVLAYDADTDGRFDTWARIDHARLVRIDRDADGDGALEPLLPVDAAFRGVAESVMQAAEAAGVTAALVAVRPLAGADR